MPVPRCPSNLAKRATRIVPLILSAHTMTANQIPAEVLRLVRAVQRHKFELGWHWAPIIGAATVALRVGEQTLRSQMQQTGSVAESAFVTVPIY